MLLTGANGSGKSSLLRLAAGLMRPAAGAFLWDGQPVAREADAHRRRLVYLGHADALKAGLTVRENLRFWADLAGLSKATAESRVETALAANGLQGLAALPARFLSAGQRRRLTLSRLLLQPAATAPLWLLDEPTNALDAEAQQRLLGQLRDHLDAGGVIVTASHEHLEDLPGRRLPVDDFEPGPFDETMLLASHDAFGEVA